MSSKSRRRREVVAEKATGTAFPLVPIPAPVRCELAPLAQAVRPRPPREVIAARAQDLWNARGRPDGCDLDIWLEAEEELSAFAT